MVSSMDAGALPPVTYERLEIGRNFDTKNVFCYFVLT